MSFQEEYTVRLGTFEGPLDLLLYLIRRAEVDIHDIPLVEITSQYLDAIEGLQHEESLDIDAAAEFLVMAATLVELKSRTLAPKRGPMQSAEDPTLRLPRRLLQAHCIQCAPASARNTVGASETFKD